MLCSLEFCQMKFDQESIHYLEQSFSHWKKLKISKNLNITLSVTKINVTIMVKLYITTDLCKTYV